MSTLLPLPVAIPFVAAALLVAAGHVLPRAAQDALAIAAAVATAAVACIVLAHSGRVDVLHWFGGWHPRHGVAIGIAFVAEPLGAGAAVLAAVLVTVSLVYSWRYLEEAGRLYRVLVLVFLSGMCGFALSADLFNLFVFFEVMGVAAFALAGYKIEELGPLQGALNFAITNTIGAYMILFGTALLYGRTGALNLAQLGKALAGHEPDGLVVVAFTLVLVGFLVKAAIVPFHLWLADAHAVAPAPICVLFSGVMVMLGLLGVARVYWTVFAAPFGADAGAVRTVLLTVGLLTAFLGGAMAFLQRHVKRLLAYSTIGHAGIVLCGIALLDSKSLAGAADLVLSHAFLKGGLFLAVGIVLQRLASVDELELHGRGRALPAVGALFGLAGIGLVGLPYLGTFAGHAQLDDGARAQGYPWLGPVLAVATGVAAAAILRAGARVFLGWGPRRDPLLSEQPPVEAEGRDAPMATLLAATAVLVVAGLASSLVPGLEARTEHAADRFRDRGAYVDRVLEGNVERARAAPATTVPAASGASLLTGLLAGVVTLALAALGLFRARLPAALRAGAARAVGPPLTVLRAAHSGVAGDYVVWLTVGTAALGAAWALALR